MKRNLSKFAVLLAVSVFGTAAFSVHAQMAGPGIPVVPTDRGGTPIYANQAGYYGLNGDCADGNCGNRGVGLAAPCAAESCGVPCDPCAVGPCLPGPCLPGPCFAGPCFPCLPFPCLGTPCGGGIFARIWNGPSYWQGPGCSERVIDELRKSWRTACPKCDIMGETAAHSSNSIGTGLRSYQLVNAGAPYGPIKMNAGQPENGFYSVPVNRGPYQSGGCSSCKNGITVTSAQEPVQMQTYARNVPQTYAQPVSQTYTQPVQAQPAVQPTIQQVQYEEPIRKTRSVGTLHYRANYAPSEAVPGYIRAQQNAEKMGIGFDDAAPRTRRNSAYAGRTAEQNVSSSGVSEALANRDSGWKAVPVSSTQIIPVNASAMETIPTPAPRPVNDSVLAAAPEVSGLAYPQTAGYPVGADCGVPCGDPCIPCGDPCLPCDPCGPGFPCGPCGLGCGPYGGVWPGLIPLAADAVRLTGRVAFQTGRAAVVGTGLVARGSVRTVGFLLWNRPLPAPMAFGYGAVPAAAPIDPIYAQNDFYLNASASAPAPGMVQDPAYAAGPNLYAGAMVPQNAVVVSDTAAANVVPSGAASVNYASSAVPAVPQTASAVGTSTASLLSAQTQRVYLEDGTEVILEHDSMDFQNRSMNASAQYAQANTSSAPALQAAVPAGAAWNAPAPMAVPVSASTASQVSLAAQQNVPLEPVPAPAGNVSADGYPIVSVETPQLQLAPGEVLVSQEDFILEPAGTVNEAGAIPSSTESVPGNKVVPAVQETPNAADPKTVRDENVTKVSWEEPAVSRSVKTEKQYAEKVSTRSTASGWQIVTREKVELSGSEGTDTLQNAPLRNVSETEASLLELKPAAPLK